MNIQNCFAGSCNVIGGFKDVFDTMEGMQKIEGLIQPILNFMKSIDREAPLSLINFAKHLRGIKALRNGFLLLGTINDARSKPFDRKSVSEVMNSAKRISFLVASLFMFREYVYQIVELTPGTIGPSIKMGILLAGTCFSAVDDFLKIRDFSKRIAHTLNEKSLFEQDLNAMADKTLKDKVHHHLGLKDVVKTDATIDCKSVKDKIRNLTNLLRETPPQKTEEKAPKPTNEKEKDVSELQNHTQIKQELDKAKTELKELRKRTWKAKIVQHFENKESSHINFSKILDMCNLIEKLTDKNLKDLKALYAMNNISYQKYKVAHITIHANILSQDRSKAYLSFALDVTKVVVLSLVILKAPIANLVPINYSSTFKKGSEFAQLVSGSLGFTKYLFDKFGTHHKELRPSSAAAA